jgi:hypothetical protein
VPYNEAVVLRFLIRAWIALLLVMFAARVRADGALPDSLGVLLPKDHPHQILVATNFGLLASDDDGKRWSLVCETAVGLGAALYQLGPMPQDRLFTVTLDGISVSNDLGCGWQHVTVLDRPSDVFPDPTDADRVLAIARGPAIDGGTHPQAVYMSRDGGMTFDEPLFIAAENAYVTGVEVAASDGDTLYVSLTLFETKESHPYLVRSRDGGKSWKMIALEDSIGMQLPRILAIDKDDATRVYLRLGSTGKDSLGIYDDASGKVDVLLTLEASMSAFLRRTDGSLIVGAADGSAFVMKAGGKSFSKLPGTPHLRGLGERDGTLYATTDTVKDGYAFASSEDDGKTWDPLLRFEDIAGLRECGTIASTCASDWDLLQMRLAMPNADPEFDAGVLPDAGPVTPPKPKPKQDDGCSASAGPAHASAAWSLGAAAVLALAIRSRRRRARGAISARR